MLCGTNNIPWNIPHIQKESGEYSMEYCQTHITRLWIWIMLCESYTHLVLVGVDVKFSIFKLQALFNDTPITCSLKVGKAFILYKGLH